MGATSTREWQWSKLVGITHATDAPWTAISVSNRQKTSGVLYDTAHEDELRFRLDLAIATATGTRAELVAQIEGELAVLNTQTSAPAPASAPQVASLPPAAWYPDPTHRFDMRYWDGARWTEHVSRAGVEAADPL